MTAEQVERSRTRCLNLSREVFGEEVLRLTPRLSVTSVTRLAAMLHDLPDHVVAEQSREGRNTIGEWVSRVYGDEVLAAKLKETADKKEMQLAIYFHLAGR